MGEVEYFEEKKHLIKGGGEYYLKKKKSFGGVVIVILKMDGRYGGVGGGGSGGCYEFEGGGVVMTRDPKPRLRWTADLHDRFVDAVTKLGGPDS